MPLYEYRCEPCGHLFETLVRSSSDVPHCPQCGGTELAKQFSVPAAAQSGSRARSALALCEPSGNPAGCGLPECRSGRCAME